LRLIVVPLWRGAFAIPTPFLSPNLESAFPPPLHAPSPISPLLEMGLPSGMFFFLLSSPIPFLECHYCKLFPCPFQFSLFFLGCRSFRFSRNFFLLLSHCLRPFFRWLFVRPSYPSKFLGLFPPTFCPLNPSLDFVKRLLEGPCFSLLNVPTVLCKEERVPFLTMDFMLYPLPSMTLNSCNPGHLLED